MQSEFALWRLGKGLNIQTRLGELPSGSDWRGKEVNSKMSTVVPCLFLKPFIPGICNFLYCLLRVSSRG